MDFAGDSPIYPTSLLLTDLIGFQSPRSYLSAITFFSLAQLVGVFAV
jgi:hypothetical protein